MQVTVIKGEEITPDLMSRWRFLQQSNSELASPFFSSEFFIAVARARRDVHLALIEVDGQIAGFFPFQRGRFGQGTPVGGVLSDYHGLVALPGKTWDPKELLRHCGLRTWDFNHLPASQVSFGPFVRKQAISPVINLIRGYESYVSEQKAHGKGQIEQCNRKLRKLEREVGAVRFEMHVPEVGLLHELMRWKGRQYLRTGGSNLFGVGWVRQVLTEIHAIQTDTFGGMLSALYADDELVAIHFGMRSSSVWHYWFPAYLPEYEKHSVGIILLLKMAENAKSMKLGSIDLGKGGQRYKTQLMNHSVRLAEGWVTLPSAMSRFHDVSRKFESFLRESRCIHAPVRWAVRKLRATMSRVKGS